MSVSTQLLRRFLQRPVVGGSAALFSGSLAAGAINYVFNIIIAREQWLGLSDYGSLAALLSSLTLASLIGTTIATVTANYTATFMAQGQPGSVGKLVMGMQRRVIRYGVPVLLLVAASSWLLADFFHLQSVVPILLLIPLILLTLLFHALTGALQGLLAFGSLALVSVSGAGLRLVLALGAVLIGWRVAGVLLASLLAQLVVYGGAYWPLRSYFAARRSAPRLPGRDILHFGGPVFIAVLGIIAFFSLDTILAKHYLPAEEAGLYSGLALLARVVYFASLPFVQVMFTVVAQSAARVPARGSDPSGWAARSQSSRAVAGLTLVATLLIAGVVSVVYFSMPQFIITVSLGSTYLPAQTELGWFAVVISFVSVSAWLIHYLLAHQHGRATWIFPAAVLVQVALITRYHASLDQIVWSSLAASTVLLVGLTSYTAWWWLQSRYQMQRFEPTKTPAQTPGPLA